MGSLASHNNETTAQGQMEPTYFFSLFLLLFFSTFAAATRFHTNVEIESKMTYRYVRTLVKSSIKNPDPQSREVTFAMVLPEPAVISNFFILADGKEYKALVMDAAIARKKYEAAKKGGLTTGLAEEMPSARKFNISVNVEANQEITFHLTYEERLERQNGFYKYRIHLETLQNIESLKVTVDMKETQPLTDLCVPLNNTAKSCKDVAKLPQANIDRTKGDKEALITFEPSNTRALEEGLNVLYSVDCPKNEIHVVCGHFIHTFCPDSNPRPKHVVFVLDTSGSMGWVKRLYQLKSAMLNLLDDKLEKTDYFSIIDFNHRVNTFQQENQKVFDASKKNIIKAKKHVAKFNATGGTNINLALLTGISLTEEATNIIQKNTAKMIVFLTDGDPTDGERNKEQIIRNVIAKNTERVPILTLGFGTQTNFKLLMQISALTDSLSKMIYDGSDAGLQLEGFFYETSRPTLSNVKLRYEGNVEQSSLTEVETGQMFQGGEQWTVMGRTNGSDKHLDVEITADSKDGKVVTRTALFEASSDIWSECTLMKKYYAYLQVKQDIRRWKRFGAEPAKQRAANVSLANNFVTELTSLVVEIPKTTPTPTAPPSSEPDQPTCLTGCENTKMSNALIPRSKLKLVNESSTVEDPDTCKITLYSEKYHTGDRITLVENVSDLTPWDFVDRLESLKVEGTCKWKIFDGQNYTGEVGTFTPDGNYQDFDDLGDLYLSAMSLKKI